MVVVVKCEDARPSMGDREEKSGDNEFGDETRETCRPGRHHERHFLKQPCFGSGGCVQKDAWRKNDCVADASGTRFPALWVEHIRTTLPTDVHVRDAWMVYVDASISAAA